MGLFVAAGCGGRTSATFGDGFDPDGRGADGSGADSFGASSSTGGASSATGGRPSQAGAPSFGATVGVAGTGVYPGGAATAGSYGYGGAYAYGGGYVGGAYPYGGAYPVGGGYPVAGTGYGGNPMQGGGNCCKAQTSPSCRPRRVAECVCEYAPYCCEKQWDSACASLVERLGCGSCEPEPVNCESCLNEQCSGELAQCFQDFGCLSIFSCVQQTGCQPFQCYAADQCGGVIDQWGGPAGYSMAVLLQAFTCSVQSGCPCN